MEIESWRFGDDVGRLRDALARGAVLAIPTESSYGLAVDPRSVHGVAAIYALKGREGGKALPVVAASLAQLAELGVDVADPLVVAAARLWPAPLTVVAPCAGALPAAAGDSTLAVRIPSHEGLRTLLAELGHALTATSANASGTPPLLDPRSVARWLAGSDAVLIDGGTLPGGPPSTLVAAAPAGERGGRVLRVGSFPPDELLRLLAAPESPTGDPPAPAVVELR